MDTSDKLALVCIMVLSIILGFMFGVMATSTHYETKAIQSGNAYYNTTNKKFTWRER